MELILSLAILAFVAVVITDTVQQRRALRKQSQSLTKR